MLLSMRDASKCNNHYLGCEYPGQLAYRKGKYKLIYGHTALGGVMGDTCAWGLKKGKAVLNCWNGWGVPRDQGNSTPPIALPSIPGANYYEL